VIDVFDKPLNLSEFTDEYREGLRQIIDAKIAGGRSWRQSRRPRRQSRT
jgi:non-homologous end joining protein Ku